MSKITCPHCQSESVQTLSMIFDSGTATAIHNTTGAGVGIGSGGGIGFGVGGAKTTSTSVSTLAAKVAPPQKKKIMLLIIALIFLLPPSLLAFVGFFVGDISVGGIFMPLLVAGLCYLTYKRILWNKNDYPRLIEIWQRKWKCLTCGHEFIPE